MMSAIHTNPPPTRQRRKAPTENLREPARAYRATTAQGGEGGTRHGLGRERLAHAHVGPLGEARVHRSGSRHDDVDPTGRKLEAQGLAQRLDVGFGGSVVGRPGHSLEGHERAQQHQTTAATVSQPLAEVVARGHDRPAVDVDQGELRREIASQERPRGTKAGCGHQETDVEILGRRGEGCVRLLLREIQRKNPRLDAVPLRELRSQFLEQLPPPRHKNEIKARRREADRQGTPDAIRGASHHGPGAVAGAELGGSWRRRRRGEARGHGDLQVDNVNRRMTH